MNMHGDLLLISNVISQFIQVGLNMFVRAISIILNLRRDARGMDG
jgi:hypothetical protein